MTKAGGLLIARATGERLVRSFTDRDDSLEWKLALCEMYNFQYGLLIGCAKDSFARSLLNPFVEHMFECIVASCNKEVKDNAPTKFFLFHGQSAVLRWKCDWATHALFNAKPFGIEDALKNAVTGVFKHEHWSPVHEDKLAMCMTDFDGMQAFHFWAKSCSHCMARIAPRDYKRALVSTACTMTVSALTTLHRIDEKHRFDSGPIFNNIWMADRVVTASCSNLKVHVPEFRRSCKDRTLQRLTWWPWGHYPVETCLHFDNFANKRSPRAADVRAMEVRRQWVCSKLTTAMVRQCRMRSFGPGPIGAENLDRALDDIVDASKWAAIKNARRKLSAGKRRAHE